jgi:SAM-dependent methyltransferase
VDYWPGNAAKSFVIGEIIEAADGKATILDHGCGRGGAWPSILRSHPALRLIAWDPHPASAQAAKTALIGLPADVFVGSFPDGATADYVVSFSVLEHVRDRPTYLQQARSALTPEGRFFLNYDDGHFRNMFDCDEPKALTTFLRRARQQRLYARNRRTGEFQRRVAANEAERLVRSAGFMIENSWYHNLAVFKWLAKNIEDDQEENFMRFWLDVEARLNRDFSITLDSPIRGDVSALWQIAPSRTLLLRYSGR